ncbi:hypothetical protein L5515_015047 [Caenorhabditis briggsae]|uniref:RNase H type-1 domain-containing protein n=1 Tax=Caenorhabditis briggsae TaxID=6238 RepID=A0AAE9EEY2_CAEBR|nr:hypothetical protein L5515_015047 [Caenorhabditis briggsae]
MSYSLQLSFFAYSWRHNSRFFAMDINTDGATSNNGQARARGGWGVVVESDRNLDRSGSSAYGNQTNNRYELDAIREATRIASQVPDRHISINTDSQYAVDSLNTWKSNWEQNGWRTSRGEPVKNQELIRDIDRNINNLRDSGKKVTLKHISGHSNDYHNTEADRLARQAAASNGRRY